MDEKKKYCGDCENLERKATRLSLQHCECCISMIRVVNII